MRLLIFLTKWLLILHHAHSSYVALVPAKFHPGWSLNVPVTVTDATEPVVVTCNILNSRKESVATGTVSVNNDNTQLLEISVGPDVQPGSGYTLKLTGTGGLSFTNSTSIKTGNQNYLTFIQTDKKIYRAGQLVRFRVMTVDKDLVPLKIAKNITIKNPGKSSLARMTDDGSKGVFEGTFQLTKFPYLGDWIVDVESTEKAIREQIVFTVDEYVLPKFEVTAEVKPGFLLREMVDGKAVLKQTMVTLSVTAMYTYGKGVLGDIKIKVGDREINSEIIDPTGKKDVELDLMKELANPVGSIPISVEVTDEAKRMYSTQVSVPVMRQAVKLEFDKKRTDLVYRPGMPLHVVLKVTDPVGNPLGPGDNENTSDMVTLSLVDRNSESSSLSTAIPLELGKMTCVWEISSVNFTANSVTLMAELKMGGKDYRVQMPIGKWETVGKAAMLNLRWTSSPPMLTMGSQVSFTVDVSNPNHFTSITYMIISRGGIQAFGSAVVGTNSVKVSTDMCPNGHLIVYGITSQSIVDMSEVIADSLELKLHHCQNKKVTPSVPVKSQRTGERATINFDVSWTDASKSSAIGVHDVYMLAVDKSILLLQGHNDFTSAKIDSQLEKFDLTSGRDTSGPVPWGRGKRSIMPVPPMSEGFTSTGELFESVGLQLLSDVAVYHGAIMYDDRMMFKEVAFAHPNAENEGANEELTSTGGVDNDVAPNTVTVRKNFPDTWIWKNAMTDSNGKLSLQETIPDTITAWTISAFAVKDDSEIAVTTDPFELNAFNPFFVDLNLPYSIRRTEKFVLRATVFNYQNRDADTTVTLAKSEDYVISGSASQTIMVKKNSANSVRFLIVANKVKTILLNVTATGGSVTDFVSRELIVKPEGVERRRSLPLAVFLTEKNSTYDKEVVLDFDPNTLAEVVPQSRRASVKITGDVMGNALSNIDDLISQPYGCGEQNMITTVPNIYALSYLTSINDVNPEFASKAKEYIIYGYNAETGQYRWDKGGYSAFGKGDGPAPSTWLTAFVVKSFAEAKPFIPVDSLILQADISVLFARLEGNGAFREDGRVIHTEMQGGSAKGDALSVYVTMCILVARDHGMEVDGRKVDLAMEHVMKIADEEDVKTNPFLAALTAYTLALHSGQDSATLEKIERLIGFVANDGKGPWLKPSASESNEPVLRYMPPSGSSDIETTSYCALAYGATSRYIKAKPMIMWLQKQQNDKGGYRSTQDTVTALQAISNYAKRFAGSVPQSNVTITVIDPPMPPKTIIVDSSNARLLQIVQLPENTNKVRIQVTGQKDGFSLVKVVWYFNSVADPEKPPTPRPLAVQGDSITLTTVTNMVLPKFHNMETCIKLGPSLNYNKMMTMTLDMPSGLQLNDIDQARSDNPSVMRLEQDKNRYHVYMNEPREQCLKFLLEEIVEVEDRKPGSAQVYAYYNPEIESETEIKMALTCPPEGCSNPCVINNSCGPTNGAVGKMSLSGFLLAATISCLLSLLLAM